MKKITIYSDGSSLGNPGNGGWAAILIYQKKEKEIFGNQKDATNNQMELKSAIEALKSLKETCQIEFYTDSEYVRKGITEWIEKWQKNNWKSANKKPVKNKELWQELLAASANHKISWHWVKAHAGNELNERVDELARNAASKLGS